MLTPPNEHDQQAPHSRRLKRFTYQKNFSPTTEFCTVDNYIQECEYLYICDPDKFPAQHAHFTSAAIEAKLTIAGQTTIPLLHYEDQHKPNINDDIPNIKRYGPTV